MSNDQNFDQMLKAQHKRMTDRWLKALLKDDKKTQAYFFARLVAFERMTGSYSRTQSLMMFWPNIYPVSSRKNYQYTPDSGRAAHGARNDALRLLRKIEGVK